jgi:signal transduction histidine kinase
MNTLDYICIGIAIVAFIAAVIVIGLYRQRTKKTLEKVGAMLDTAVSGNFTEDVFDESVLSAVEAKLARYLSICTVSSKNLQAEKDKIKELISDISHQTKTPIANILLYSQLLSEQELPEIEAFVLKALSAQQKS